MRQRFPIGLIFAKKRFPKAKETTAYQIDDVYTTRNNAGVIVSIEYVVSHEFMGQRIQERMVDTTIARSLSNEQLKQYA